MAELRDSFGAENRSSPDKQVLQRLSPERCEVTGESSNCTGRVWQQEVTNESPTDHASDQENEEDKDNLSEVSHKDDQMEFIKEFQDFMNEAIEQLLKKPARKHPRRKDKPELCMEQGKRKEVLRKEVETLPLLRIEVLARVSYGRTPWQGIPRF